MRKLAISAPHPTLVRSLPSAVHCHFFFFTAVRAQSQVPDPVNQKTASPAECALCDVQWTDELWRVSVPTSDASCAISTSSTSSPSLSDADHARGDVQQRWWKAHRLSPGHIAREAICEQFLAPDRSDHIMHHMTQHLRVDLRTLDDVERQRVERRRRRLLSSLLHLLEKRAVHLYVPHRPSADGACASSSPQRSSVPSHTNGDVTAASSTFSATPTSTIKEDVTLVSDAFVNHMLAGAAYARCEVMDRVARLMPRSGATELSSITAYILSTRRLANLYDDLKMDTLLTHATAREGEEPVIMTALTAREKAVVVYSCLGELSLFSQQQTRPRGVTDKTAADRLVLNVLASHAADGLLSDLVHGTLQRVVDEGLPVFQQYKETRVIEEAKPLCDNRQ